MKLKLQGLQISYAEINLIICRKFFCITFRSFCDATIYRQKRKRPATSLGVLEKTALFLSTICVPHDNNDDEYIWFEDMRMPSVAGLQPFFV